MKATNINGSPTLYQVEAESYCCTDVQCDWNSTAAYAWQVGDKCPKCLQLGRSGTVKHNEYQVDLRNFDAIGQCDCLNWKTKHGPNLMKLSPSQRQALTQAERSNYRCKHISLARDVAKTGAMFDALLMTLPAQSQEGAP